uniref:Putative phosphoribulokinase / Uridine kinase family protein n=1 Tax=uncultured marine microorganism HF4000_APKG10F17 TaxID=455558 RepID=B3TC18_9ZZZZ|nr:putative phosphoribulokinase / Uridine kinase family protein [uncultured marine microorganism HF4000_APKG10F17]
MEEILACIKAKYEKYRSINQSFVIGINGIDCSGKTTFAKLVSKYFTHYKIENVCRDIDNFNNPAIESETYKAFVSGSWDEEDLNKYYELIINFSDATRVVSESKKKYSVVILEGIFIYKPQLVDIFDLKIYLDIDISLGRKRFAKRRSIERDKRPFDIYDEIWMLSHLRYESEVHPKRISDLVIDYNAESQPVLHGNIS